MPEFEVDLNTKIVDNNTKIYLARAGKQGHMFLQVKESGVIGPDLPNIDPDLSKGYDNDKQIENKIKMSRALVAWLRNNSNSRRERPTLNIDYYSQEPRRSGHAQIEGIVRSYFRDMNAGDIVVIPNPSIFQDAIIGELLPIEIPSARIPGIGRYEGFHFNGRRFRSPKSVKMNALPRAVVDLAATPTGLSEIYSNAARRAIIDLMYDNYIYGGDYVSKIITTEQNFKSFDGNVLNAFVTMVAENVYRLDKTEHAGLLNLFNAAFHELKDSELQVKIDISSPGFLAALDRTIAPLVIGALLSILISVNFDPSAFASEINVKVTNTATSELVDLCAIEVQQKTKSLLKIMSSYEDEFAKDCELLKKTHDNTGARTEVKTKVVP